MKFWPSDKFEIETTMLPQDIVASLNSNVEPKKLYRMSKEHAPFQGNISPDGFKIIRIIHYRNSFLPVIKGRFLPGDSGIKVAIRMELHPLVALFMLVWFGGIGLGLLAAIVRLLNGHTLPYPMLLIPSAMLVVGWAITLCGFWFEVKKQKKMLIEMLKGT